MNGSVVMFLSNQEWRNIYFKKLSNSINKIRVSKLKESKALHKNMIFVFQMNEKIIENEQMNNISKHCWNNFIFQERYKKDRKTSRSNQIHLGRICISVIIDIN